MLKFALVQPDNTVQIIVPGTARYRHAQYTAVQVQSGVVCAAGMYFNKTTGLFYDDAAFTKIGGVAVDAESA
jgi:hypothetical protein